MAQREVITEATIQAALEALEKRVAAPPPPTERRYSRKEAFLKLRMKAREALAAGHSLQAVLDDLKGVGLGMTISTARQYLKPGRKSNRVRAVTRIDSAENPVEMSPRKESANSHAMKKGAFAVTEDENEI
jgi:hypothetical protein